MARAFDGTDDHIDYGDIPVIDDATSYSFSAWAFNNNITANHAVAGTRVSNPGFIVFQDDVGFDSGRTDIWKFFHEDSSVNGTSIETATNSAKLQTWQQIGYTFQANTSSTGMHGYVEGVEDANSPISTAGIGAAGSSENLRVGEFNSGGGDRDGNIAEVAFWDRILSPSEMAMLGLGYSPLFIPRNLVFYSPLIGTESPELELILGNNGTVTGATKIEHPEIIMPTHQQLLRFGGVEVAARIPRYGFTNHQIPGIV